MGHKTLSTMRGRQLLKGLVRDFDDPQAHKPGRNETLLARRNECLLTRYFYYGYHRKKGYEEIVQLLVAEFFITGERIGRILHQHSKQIIEMREKKISKFHMQVLWPHYKW